MSNRIHIVVADSQLAYLRAEADRSSISVSELVRRALDATYGPRGERRVFSITHTLGRRPGKKFDDLDDFWTWS
jgi:hypothetical protein